MKAVFVHDDGGRRLTYGELPDPSPAPGEAIVRLKAAGLNRMDLYMRDSGAGVPHALPFVLGGDGAGEIVEAPAGSKLKPGQRMVLYPAAFDAACPASMAGDQTLSPTISYLGMSRSGTFAQYIAMPAHCLVPLPEGADLQRFGALPVAYLTAYRMIFGPQPVRPGETVLIVGIGGGVAVACLQLAVLAGARTIVTSSSTEKLDSAKRLGAAQTINHKETKISEQVAAMTDRRGVDVVIDNVGEATWSETFKSVRAGGRMMVSGSTSGAVVNLNLQRLFARQVKIVGSTLGSMGEFAQLVGLVANGQINPVIDETVPLADAETALMRMERGDKFGKIAIAIG
ncbi:MAG: zinc-binding dehydrogenase [Mesorhizobium sp.]|nr:zinc-binding dehydrogenase [Mesorhizobium sp.]